MATRSKSTDETPDPQPNAAIIRTQEYAAGEGWEIGQTAPADAFRSMDNSGSGELVGPVVDKHPGGYARQIVVKGGLVTAGVKRDLDDAKADETEQG